MNFIKKQSYFPDPGCNNTDKDFLEEFHFGDEVNKQDQCILKICIQIN